MKIALVIERMEIGRGGREKSTAQVACSLADRGHDVTILCQLGSLVSEKVKVQCLGRRGLGRLGRLKNFVADIQNAIRDEKFDIVHTTLPVPGANIYQLRSGSVPGQIAAVARRWGSFSAVKIAISRMNAVRRLMGKYESQVLADAGTLSLPISQMVADELTHFYKPPRQPKVLFNAVDIPDIGDDQRNQWRNQLRDKWQVGPDDPVFITVAKNYQLKGIDHAIVTFARYFHENRGKVNARLVIVGKESPEAYMRHASLRDVGRQVVFVGPTDNIFQYYSAADACILLSWYDSCSRVVLEAVRWQLPTITTQFNGAAEILASGAGLVVKTPKDYPAIIAAFNELSNREFRQSRIDHCLLASGMLTMDRHIEKLLAAYREVAK